MRNVYESQLYSTQSNHKSLFRYSLNFKIISIVLLLLKLSQHKLIA